jgi:hypothetical protein
MWILTERCKHCGTVLQETKDIPQSTKEVLDGALGDLPPAITLEWKEIPEKASDDHG